MYFRTGEEKNMNLFCCKIAIIHCLLHSSKTMQLCETFLSNLPTYTHTHTFTYIKDPRVLEEEKDEG